MSGKYLWISASALLAGAEIPSHAQTEPAVPDQAWADNLRSVALASAPPSPQLVQDAAALFKSGWNPYFGFPQVTIDSGRVTEYDWGSGSWRSTPVESYLKAAPQWTPLFALQTLSSREKARFQPRPWNNLNCLGGASTRCFIAVTTGGFDEIRWVEIDGSTKAIPSHGYDLPAGRSSLAWLQEDEVLVAAAKEGGRISSTGYPLTVRLWRRGQPLASAQTIFEAPSGTGMVALNSFQLGAARLGLIETFEGALGAKTWVVGTDRRPRDSGLPTGSSVAGMMGADLIVPLRDEWQWRGERWPAGSVVAIDAAALAEGRGLAPRSVLRAGNGKAVEMAGNSPSLLTTSDAVYLSVLEGGSRSVHKATRQGNTWSVAPLANGEGKVAKLIASDPAGTVALASVESMVEAPSLLRIDTSEPQTVRKGTSFFDPTGLKIERRRALGKDGVPIPYWLVRKAGLKGPVPTILHGYGASNVSLLPTYSADVGRLWLKKGGAFAIAQVRGGGEYGPKWSQAGRGAYRGQPVQDFIAVAEHLIKTRVTDKRRLGADGQSDGGRLVAGAAMLRPDLFAAVVSRDGAVFPELAAGAAGSPVFAEDLKLLESPEGRALAATYWPSRMYSQKRGCPKLALTSWRGDQRVPAMQSRALAAMLRKEGCPVLLLEQPGGEHSTVSADMLAFIYSYFHRQLGLEEQVKQ